MRENADSIQFEARTFRHAHTNAYSTKFNVYKIKQEKQNVTSTGRGFFVRRCFFVFRGFFIFCSYCVFVNFAVFRILCIFRACDFLASFRLLFRAKHRRGVAPEHTEEVKFLFARYKRRDARSAKPSCDVATESLSLNAHHKRA